MTHPGSPATELGSIQTTASGRKHIPELDALRGAAAFCVVLNHFHQVWLGSSHPAWISRPKLNPLLWLLVNGHSAVLLFFLISGFALTLPTLRGSNQSYPQFLVRRVCRIYPPFFAGMAIAITGCSLFWGRTDFGSPVSELWRYPPDVRSILPQLALLGRFDVYRYDGPIWSLVHEVRISIVFPLLALLARRLSLWATLAVAVGCTVLSSLSFRFMETGLPATLQPTAWSLTLGYCGTFLLGSALALRHERYVDALQRWSPTKKSAAVFTGFVLYLYPPPTVCGIAISDFVSSCGGFILIACCLQRRTPLTNWLRTSPFQFLGRTSYSLYLVHYPVLLMMAYSFHRGFPAVRMLVPFLAVALAAATLLYEVVELPSIALGRKVSAAL